MPPSLKLNLRSMPDMNFIPLEIPDVVLIRPVVHSDARGFFFESYRGDLFVKNGIKEHFVQDNCSLSVRGVLRGLHYQTAPHAQAKLIRVVRGSVFDVAVDLRPKSPHFGKWVSYVLTGNSKEMLYIPRGFAHGFCALEDATEFMYKVSDYYVRDCEKGILWNDPALSIPWPKMEYVLSEKDKKYPMFQEAFGARPSKSRRP